MRLHPYHSHVDLYFQGTNLISEYIVGGVGGVQASAAGVSQCFAGIFAFGLTAKLSLKAKEDMFYQANRCHKQLK
jgi:hypothetical protein